MTTLRRLHSIALFIFVIPCVGCNLAPARFVPTATVADVPAVQVQTTPIPTIDRQLHNVIATSTAQPTATDVATQQELIGCPQPPGQVSSLYALTTNIDYANHFADVDEHITYTNRSDTALDQIVLSVEANNWSGAFHLQSVQLNGADTIYSLNARVLSVALAQSLLPGCHLSLELTFRVYPPFITGDVAAYRGFFGFSQRQLNFGNWLPVVAALVDGQWVTHQIVFIGEQVALESADWDVTVNLVGDQTNVEIAAPGEKERLGDNTWHFLLDNARDFTLSLSEWYQVLRERLDSGVTVELYHFGDTLLSTDTGYVDAAADAMDAATQSFAMYEDRYGPYPWSRIVIVQGDFPDGMEFSGLVFVSTNWFVNYPNSPISYLTTITVHELAHQWWYAQVGNDAALYPWLDEALATYSEYLFYEQFYPDLKERWWAFRIGAYEPEGYVDSTVYDFDTARHYINAIYLRGAEMLNDLRADLGDDAFFDLLRRYAAEGAGRLVTPDFFWSLMTPEQFDITRPTRVHYLHQPDVAYTPPSQ